MASMTAIPSRLLLQPTRLAMAEAQKQLTDAQAEASTGRHANMSLALGAATGSDIGLRIQIASATQDLVTTEQAKAKAGILQTSLSNLTELAGTFRSTLTGTRNAANGRSIAAAAAASALASLREGLNASYDGQYLFGGLNSGTPPINDYTNGPHQTITSAFLAEFGFPPEDPATASLTPAQISGFLDGSFNDLFAAASWSGTWSNAADETAVVRLGNGEEIDTGASANAPFARKISAALSMIDVLGRSHLGQAALETVIDTSLTQISEAQVAIGDEQARIGIGENRIAGATSNIEQRKEHFMSAVKALEGVDSYEAATRINVLMSELEASYALTARLSRMSLLSYI